MIDDALAIFQAMPFRTVIIVYSVPPVSSKGCISSRISPPFVMLICPIVSVLMRPLTVVIFFHVIVEIRHIAIMRICGSVISPAGSISIIFRIIPWWNPASVVIFIVPAASSKISVVMISRRIARLEHPVVITLLRRSMMRSGMIVIWSRLIIVFDRIIRILIILVVYLLPGSSVEFVMASSIRGLVPMPMSMSRFRRRHVLALIPAFDHEEAISHQQAQQQQQPPVARHFVSAAPFSQVTLHHHGLPRDCGFHAVEPVNHLSIPCRSRVLQRCIEPVQSFNSSNSTRDDRYYVDHSIDRTETARRVLPNLRWFLLIR